MKTSTPLAIAMILIIALALSMLTSCDNQEKPITTEASVIQDVYLKGSILYYKNKPVILDDKVRDLLEQGKNNLPIVATYVVEYKGYYYMALD